MADLDAPSPRHHVRNGGQRGALAGRQGPAVAALGALLDRSLVLISDASADARSFDRETIRRAADVWDNNTLPLFRAATGRTRTERERRALEALEWMACLGGARRSWMLEQASAAGHPLGELLAPAKPHVPGRDYLGRVMARVMQVTQQTAESLAADYDLPSAEVRRLQVERAGSRLDAHLELAVPRSYPFDGGASPETATLDVRLRDVHEVRFDSRDARGAALRPDTDGVAIGIGDGGVIRAAAADLHPDDRCWHLSAAGRRADATTPPRDSQPARAAAPQDGHLGANATAAATVLHRAMLEIRTVRYAAHAHRVPLHDFHRAFAGAGEAVLSAGANRLPDRREAAFDRLIETWARRGGPALADWFAEVLSEPTHPPRFLAALLAEARARPVAVAVAVAAADAPQQPAPGPAAVPAPRKAELRLAAYTAAHTRYGTPNDASVLLHLAVDPDPESAEDVPWYMRAMQGADPAHFRLRTEAFRGAARPRVTVDADGARQFVLLDGALNITSGKAVNHDRL